MLMVPLQLVGCVFVADFLSGLVHWLEDSYGREDQPVWGAVLLENNRHHQQPGYFTGLSWWESSKSLVLVAAAAGLVVWCLGLFSWQLAVVLVLGANANQIHKWAHRSRRRNGPAISLLQDWGVFQSAAHHAGHHAGRRWRRRFCVLTPHLNRWLDGIGFWHGLERGIELLTGVAPRDPNSGPLPAPARVRPRPGTRGRR